MIGLDPGHGGSTRGTALKDGGDEADYVLSFARHLHGELRERGERSVLLRHYDQTIPLHERGQLAAANGCKLVVSLHVNAGPSPLRGLSCFVWPGDVLGLSAAQRVVAARPPALIGTCQSIVVVNIEESLHWTRDARSVLRPYWRARGIPVVLVELGFGRADADALLDIATQQLLAASLAAALEGLT